MMLKCLDTKKMMSLYLDNQLSENEHIDFEKHMQSCDSCRDELEILETIINGCGQLEEIELPHNFSEGLHKKLVNIQQGTTVSKNVSKMPWYFNWRTYSSLAAGLLIIMVIKTYFIDSQYLSQKAYIYEADIATTENSSTEVTDSLKVASQNPDHRDELIQNESQIKQDIQKKVYTKKEANTNETYQDEGVNNNHIEDNSFQIASVDMQDNNNVLEEVPASDSLKKAADSLEKESDSIEKAEASGGTRMMMAGVQMMDTPNEIEKPKIISEIQFKTSVDKYKLIYEKLNSAGIVLSEEKSKESKESVVLIIDSNSLATVMGTINNQGIDTNNIVSIKDVTDEYNNILEQLKQLEQLNLEHQAKEQNDNTNEVFNLKEKLRLIDEQLKNVKVKIVFDKT